MISLFITIAGFIIGLGAVTVIDIHGFLGRRSSYWTEATIRTHKVTKPLIWYGMALVIIGTHLLFRDGLYDMDTYARILGVQLIMILNGCFLSFVVSPFLLNREREGKSRELLPQSLQYKIAISFVVSFVSWWGLLVYLLDIYTN
jgi:hypothetical protein